MFSNLDFVGAGAMGLIAAGIPPAQAAVLATDPNYNPLLGLQGIQFLPQFVNYPNVAQDGKSNDDNVDYTFKLSYLLNESTTYTVVFQLVIRQLHGISQEILYLMQLKQRLLLQLELLLVQIQA